MSIHFRIISNDRATDEMAAWALTEELIARRMNGEMELSTNGTVPFETRILEETYGDGQVKFTVTVNKGLHEILVRRCILPTQQ
ncbi:MAG: hypothetical protein M3R08_08630 [Bacteroidota bacterium]|nr:hypothetical protein [Bacteroidota bacterium]